MIRSFLLVCWLSLCTIAFSAAPAAAAPHVPFDANVTYEMQSGVSGNWAVTLRTWKGTIAAIRPNLSDPFSFINDDSPGNYSTRPYHHSHGDITLRLRPAHTAQPWQQYTTADSHAGPAQPLPVVAGELAAFDVTGLMKPGHTLSVVRRYASPPLTVSWQEPALSMEVVVTNTGNASVELGGFGVSALFSSNWNDMDLGQAAAACSLAEPFIGGDHGWVKVTRMTGGGRVLLMQPTEGHRRQSGLVAWRQLKGEDVTPTGYTFEGHYEWTSVVGAWQDEWKQEQPWVTPHQATYIIEPKQQLKFRYTYQLVDSVRGVDAALSMQGNVTIRAVPGYILSTEMRDAKLIIRPPYAGIPSPLPTFDISGPGKLTLEPVAPKPGNSDLVYRITAVGAGRVHIAVHFNFTAQRGLAGSATTAHVSMLVLPPLRSHLVALGRFTGANQWVDSAYSDPFGRAASVMPYDYEAGSVIWQDDRSYVVGLSDEAGAGPSLQLVMSQRYAPFDALLQLVDTYINRTLWGAKSPPDVPYPTSIQNANHSVRASMFWYPAMPNYTYQVSGGWDQDRASQLWRSYNYVHPTVLYHAMYRLTRDYDGASKQQQRLYSADWYLDQAYQTFVAMFDNAPYYTQFGLMEGSVFLDLMEDLRLEGRTEQYNNMFQLQQQRVTVWQQLPFPFGSEMPWDSTGQEEIWLSAQQFGAYDLSNSSLSAMLAYMHPIPVWAYHGSARRFWDFWINGKPNYTQDWPERNLHHYGSSLNAKPLLRAYEINPDDHYLLDPAIGAMTGVLSNIQPSGAASMGFHGDNALLRHDPFDADYGCALYGHVTSATAYYVHHPNNGESCYLCNLHHQPGGAVTIEPVDSLQRRLYLEPLGTAVAVDVGRIASVSLSLANRTAVVELVGADDPSMTFSAWRVSVTHFALCDARPGCDIRIVSPAVKQVRGAWTFPYTSSTATVTLTWSSKASAAGTEVGVATATE